MRFLLACITALAMLPISAFAWGLSTELNKPWARARLVFPVLKEKEIRFCIANHHPEQFSDRSLQLQVRAALALWLAALEPLKLGKISVKKVECDSKNFHLMVEVGKENNWPGLGTYQLSTAQGSHFYSLVKIDTTYRYSQNNSQYSITDFLHFHQSLTEEKLALETISFRQPSSVQEYARTKNIEEVALFLSTYSSLIHELGHSFGLCDTYVADFKDECDPLYSSHSHEPSVMRDSETFFIKPDDIHGIRALFQRYLK